MTQAHSPHFRALYRSILRELPARPVTSPPSPLKARIRQALAEGANESSPETALRRRHEADQFVQYVQAQRRYITLLERYNPGMTMDDQDRTRRTARRVGMDMPVEFKLDKKE